LVSLWECEDGTAVTDASVEIVAGASGGSVVRVDFATVEEMYERLNVTIGDITANYDDQRGYYEVLLGAMGNGGGEYLARMAYGQADVWTFYDPVKIIVPFVGNARRFYSVGRIRLPAAGRLTQIQGTSIRIDAARILGSGGGDTLDLDCLVLIPIDEGYCHFSGAQISQANDWDNIVYNLPEGRIHSEVIQPGGIGRLDTSGTSPERLVIPPGEVRMVVAGQHGAGGYKTGSTVDIDLDVYPRWATLRGAE
jgi:hypothetical protein